MTTKPKAKKFRIRRSAASGDAAEEAQQPSPAAASAADMDAQSAAQHSAAAAGAERRTAAGARRRAAAAGEAVQADRLADETMAQPSPQPSPQPGAPAGAQAGAQPGAQPGAQAAAAAAAPPPMSPDQEIDQIRREGLTGRQLRMARRLAQKHGVAAISDFDAVRLLRAKGIDPFERSNMLALVQNNGGAMVADQQKPSQLPQTFAAAGGLPSTDTMNPAERRAVEVEQIQRDIAKRRRKRLTLLLSRLGAFVFLPTLVTGYYFYAMAAPLYATDSEFLILEADGGGGSAIGGLLSGTQFATNQDSIATQSYLQSKDAMIRLDRDAGFKAHFSHESIDPIQRLDPNPSNEQAYKLFKKMVKIGYDPTEGVIRMEVIAADPALAADFSSKLISYAEERVDDLSRRKREDQLRDSRSALENAKIERRQAQANLVGLQEGSILDPEGVIASLREQISRYEVELQEKQLQLQQLLDNTRPNRARVQGVQGDVRRLDAVLTSLQNKMNAAASGGSSLAQKTAQIQMAQADLATADLFLQTALQNLKSTEQEANRQVRYLTTSVAPVASEDPSYPRKFENTVLAFLIFSGVYLMISLTASILREQVSS